MNEVNRYADVAERELRDGSLRGPAWEEALKEAGGNEDLARDLYQHRRVAENLKIEEHRTAAAKALRKQRELNDSLALSFPRKVGLLGFGVALMLIAYQLFTK
jgi:hypothetical protein